MRLASSCSFSAVPSPWPCSTAPPPALDSALTDRAGSVPCWRSSSLARPSGASSPVLVVAGPGTGTSCLLRTRLARRILLGLLQECTYTHTYTVSSEALPRLCDFRYRLSG